MARGHRRGPPLVRRVCFTGSAHSSLAHRDARPSRPETPGGTEAHPRTPGRRRRTDGAGRPYCIHFDRKHCKSLATKRSSDLYCIHSSS
ncbi:hypothetical protein FMEAI12_4570021 [Parafrankia sp. Ea1.12]|nr:hypothetical protein FMEAI12_4570021 [Parafrankia sp. Ea1.12]